MSHSTYPHMLEPLDFRIYYLKKQNPYGLYAHRS